MAGKLPITIITDEMIPAVTNSIMRLINATTSFVSRSPMSGSLLACTTVTICENRDDRLLQKVDFDRLKVRSHTHLPPPGVFHLSILPLP